MVDGEALRVLILEDSPTDAALLLRELGELDCVLHTEVVMSAEGMSKALESSSWDIVLSDYAMPGFGAMQALEILRATHTTVPFVVMSGTIGEQRAVELLRGGVTDYVMKEQLGRITTVVSRAVREAREHVLLNDAQQQLVRAGLEWLNTFNALSDGVLLLDEDGVVRRMNGAVTELVGLPVEQVEGRPAREILFEICPGADTHLRAWNVRTPERYEVPGCLGSSRWLEVSCDPIGPSEDSNQGYVLVISDITHRKAGEEELRTLLSRLERTMAGTVSIAVRMVESRDPYTAGHQERVAEFAVAIAQRLGASVQDVNQIRTAALLHDIGKIAVPAEILVRPGQLQPLEWELIKRHPTVGAEILRDAEFEGPISEIVLQHHERLDGTGYPRGLAGDDICQQARIVTVADVTEAMTAHRPYRPACTDEQVTDELTSGRGTRYAPDVVDACLAHLQEHGSCLTP